MKQKIVVKVHMTCDKCRSRAMKIAAVEAGVNSVAIEGADKDEVVVIGDGVDSVCLATKLRKKLGIANIVSIEEVKEKKKGGKKEEDKPKPPEITYTYVPYPPPYPCSYQPVYCEYPSTCSLM